MLNNEVRKTKMDDLFTRFFSALYQFHKLHMGDLVPDITKIEGMTMLAIRHCNGEMGKEELTVSELTAKLKAKGPAVSRTLKTLEDKGYIERDVNKADRRNTYVKLTDFGKKKTEECEQIMSNFAHAVISKMDRDDMEGMIDCLNELYEAAKEEIADRKMRQKGE